RRRRIHADTHGRRQVPLPRLSRESSGGSHGRHVLGQTRQCHSRSKHGGVQSHRRARVRGGNGGRGKEVGQAWTTESYRTGDSSCTRGVSALLGVCSRLSEQASHAVSGIAPNLPARWKFL